MGAPSFEMQTGEKLSSRHKEEHMNSTESVSQDRHPRRRYWWLLAALPLVVAGAVGAHAYAFGGDGFPGMGLGWHGPGGHKAFMQRRLEKMLDEVKATDTQRAAIKSIVARLHSEMEPIHKEHASLHDQMLQAFAANTVDGSAVEALRVQATALVEKGSQALTRALVDAANILTPEQRQIIITHIKEHHGRMHQP
jgi:protein CpxP